LKKRKIEKFGSSEIENIKVEKKENHKSETLKIGKTKKLTKMKTRKIVIKKLVEGYFTITNPALFTFIRSNWHVQITNISVKN
ncbi:hypothetical protein, partial [Enterobacter cloacae complex sp. 2DZ2F20B]|uniref:hypothetical protein n=1 Tax=Enterobacter cloacae complex sp. 2DZ2F20B TaxID=2511993 RepID=UPI00102545AA